MNLQATSAGWAWIGLEKSGQKLREMKRDGRVRACVRSEHLNETQPPTLSIGGDFEAADDVANGVYGVETDESRCV